MEGAILQTVKYASRHIQGREVKLGENFIDEKH